MAFVNLLQAVYPVGSIYQSVTSTSPASVIGGTWSAIKDRFLVGAGSSYAATTQGGEATHKLTVDEMPSHNHLMGRFWHVATTGNIGQGTYWAGEYDTYDTAYTGGGLLTTISHLITEFICGSEQPKTSLAGAVI